MKASCFGFLTAGLLLTGSLYAAQGGYVGVGLGQSDFGSVEEDGVSGDTKDTAWKLFGGFQVNENFAVEAAYTDLGKATASGSWYQPGYGQLNENLAVESSAFEVSALGIMPLNEQFSVYGRFGLDRVSVDTDYSLYNASVRYSASETNDDFGLTYGAGVSLNLGTQFSLRAEYQVFADVAVSDDDNSDENSGDIDLLNIAAVFKF